MLELKNKNKTKIGKREEDKPYHSERGKGKNVKWFAQG